MNLLKTGTERVNQIHVQLLAAALVIGKSVKCIHELDLYTTNQIQNWKGLFAVDSKINPWWVAWSGIEPGTYCIMVLNECHKHVLSLDEC